MSKPRNISKRVRVLTMLLAVMSGAFFSIAQSPISRVAGIARDRITGKGLEGVYVGLTGVGEPKSAITDREGRFEIDKIAPGRYVCTTSIVGYGPALVEVLVISGKVSNLNIDLTESTTELEEVAVHARAATDESGITTSLPIEKVLRFPANFFDPVRMLSSYPGVIAANDQANNIVVKGNSPNGLLWRLNGMDIVNPNHLANAGTFSDRPAATGGGVNILSAQMLDRTDFYSGNIPSRYGNVSSGVLDMSLREGNNLKNEYTAQASLIGLDFSAEGPISRKTPSSFLANYRYSTVGLLSQMGVNFGGEAITFQDFSFNLTTAAGKNGKFSFFGLGGLSKNDFESRDPSEWEVEKDLMNIHYSSTMFGLGIRHDQQIDDRKVFSAGVTVSGNDQNRETTTSQPSVLFGKRSTFSTQRTLVSSYARLTAKFSPSWKAEGGIMFNYFDDQRVSIDVPSALALVVPEITGATRALVQPHLQVTYSPGRFSAEIGGRGMISTNGKQTVDYRGHLQYKLTRNSLVTLSGGQISQQAPLAVYLKPGNEGLGFMSKRFIEAGHQAVVSEWRINSSLYYQVYADVPVESGSAFSLLNYMDGDAAYNLLETGTGTNKGFTLQAERSFLSDFYLLAGGSLYDSRYVAGDGVERNTRFNGRYAAQVTLGREKSKQSDTKTRAFGIHTRLLYMGGFRETPIDLMASQFERTTIFNEQQAFESVLKDYFRMDLRLSWRKDKGRYTRTVSVDIQNVTAQKNEAYHYYDAFLNEIKTQYQVGIIPVLVYRIDF